MTTESRTKQRTQLNRDFLVEVYISSGIDIETAKYKADWFYERLAYLNGAVKSGGKIHIKSHEEYIAVRFIERFVKLRNIHPLLSQSIENIHKSIFFFFRENPKFLEFEMETTQEVMSYFDDWSQFEYNEYASHNEGFREAKDLDYIQLTTSLIDACGGALNLTFNCFIEGIRQDIKIIKLEFLMFAMLGYVDSLETDDAELNDFLIVNAIFGLYLVEKNNLHSKNVANEAESIVRNRLKDAATVRHKRENESIQPKIKKVIEVWSGNNPKTLKGWGTYSECAAAIFNRPDIDMPFRTVCSWISNYEKSKRTPQS